MATWTSRGDRSRGAPRGEPEPARAATHLAPLIAAARCGDRQALDALFGGCRGYLLAIANKRLNDSVRPRVGASDLVQSTLLHAHQRFNSFDGQREESLLAWLTDILDKNIKEAWRRHVRTQMRDLRRELSLDRELAGSRSLLVEHRDPGAPAAARDEAARLADAMKRLSSEHRMVIQLRSLQGLSFEEVGRALGRTSVAARSLWNRAIGRLTRELGLGNDPRS